MSSPFLTKIQALELALWRSEHNHGEAVAVFHHAASNRYLVRGDGKPGPDETKIEVVVRKPALEIEAEKRPESRRRAPNRIMDFGDPS